MNKEFLKRLTLSHSWIGLIISGLLFTVFFAGSISFFRPEIAQWTMQPHLKLTQGKPALIREILQSALSGRNYDAKEHLTLRLPTSDNPYVHAYIDIKDRDFEPHYDSLMIDPVTAQVVSEGDKFQLAEFIYDLHISLNIPNGRYIIGVVALFFSFALLSGIFIHARKLIKNFFQYRNSTPKRSQLLDMHNVIGVISLPYTIMYAITGLIFNLVIIYQIAFALILYQGDQSALLRDAGYVEMAPEWLDQPIEINKIDSLVIQATERYGYSPRVITFYNYGDASAVIQLRGNNEQQLGDKYNIYYSLKSGETLLSNNYENPNTLQQGLQVISQLHFGNYAGFDLRIIYFILGISVCVLIVSGNLLWIEKRMNQRNCSARSVSMARYVTNLGSVGLIFATCCAFLAERLLPISMLDRADYMVFSFCFAFLSYGLMLLSPLANQQRRMLGYTLYSCSLILTMVLVLDWSMFGYAIVELWQQGTHDVVVVEIGLIISIVGLILSGKHLCKTAKVQQSSSIDAVAA